ncbi:transposon Ty3-I Gag-Pol polyprotein [Trichonephila clavipes]|nr:transposon Ty3-I Gag-Pol polyprotein [Trichonephila clavipes]
MWRTAGQQTCLFPLRTSWTCNALLPREKGCLWITLETADGTSTTLALKKKYADQTLPAVLRQVPREAGSPIRRYRSLSPYRRSSQSPGRRSEENPRRATFQGGEAACTGNPPSTAKMTGNQLDVIIDKKPDTCSSRFWGIVFVISDKYRRFLKKVLFADAKSVMLKVADGNFVRPIGKCVLRVRINNRELPLNLLFYHIVAMTSS